MNNFKMAISYDGTDYFGWQNNQKYPSIEGTLKEVLERVLQHSISLQATSRTDKGVHANEQIVNFFSQNALDLNNIHYCLNQLLPPSIRILELSSAAPSFHPTLDCTSKEYHYQVYTGRWMPPRHRLHAWHVPYFLDFPQMTLGAKMLEGTHDFRAFTNSRRNFYQEDTSRTIFKIEITPIEGEFFQFKIHGNRFLYKMVRNIVGTLTHIGCNKLSLSELPLILSNCERAQAGVAAPAHGLTLQKVYF